VNSVVLDASAIIAFLRQEPGAAIVGEYLTDGMASAVNIAEVGTRLSDLDMGDAQIRRSISVLGLEIKPFDLEAAYAVAMMRAKTRNKGLSLGDRACLALANQLGIPALTADRVWAELDIDVDIQLIRP
jgi:PIN domain nuclease of toxin-antitoxin system